jgi:hypothetical protein
MRSSQTNAKDFVGYKKGEDYDPERVRPGPKGGVAPEFKCFNCDTWFDGNGWRYSLSKAWYPFLKYKINFLCGSNCSLEISEKHKEKYVGSSE